MSIQQQPFKMNLQLFGNDNIHDPEFQNQVMGLFNGDGQAPQGTEQPGPQAGDNPQSTENSGQADTKGQEVPQQNSDPASQSQGDPNQPPENQEQPTQQAPVDPNSGLILGKFKSPEELINAYQQLESFNTKTRQELAAERQQKEQIAAALEQSKTQQQDQNVTQNSNQEDVPEVDNEAFLNKFYENAPAAIQELVNAAFNQNVKPQIEPVVQKYQQDQQQADWNARVADFANQHGDFQDHQPIMGQILQEMPELGDHPRGLDIVYAMAKGQNARGPEAYLNDENFVNQVLSNPENQKKIIQDYLEGVKQNNQAPITIANQNAGSMPITPETKPTNMDEANAMALRMLQG